MFSFFIDDNLLESLENREGNEYILGDAADIIISEQRIRFKKKMVVYYLD
jgi:hypothetical protein